jgi:FtsH-binding integral membrane protein
MAGGLGITGVVAYLAASSPAMISAIYGTPLKWLVMFAPLAMVFFLAARISTMSLQAAQIAFWSFAGIMGLSLSYVFLMFTGESVAQAFFVTAGTFGAMSIYGYTTKRDLTSMGAFMMMGLFGVLIAALVNLFLQSPALQFVVSMLSVVVFVGLTAFDVQNLKNTYNQVSGDAHMTAKIAIYGALTLYMDFINLFINILHLIGDRK